MAEVDGNRNNPRGIARPTRFEDGGTPAVVASSSINRSASGLSLANASVVKLDDNRQITVICGGASTSTKFIVDVVGYYR